jgi:hypothetical protein
MVNDETLTNDRVNIVELSAADERINYPDEETLTNDARIL